MQAVGKLDEDDADVLRHRQQHLAEVFRLLFFLGAELDLVDLADAVDQRGHVATEQLGDLVLAVRRVLDYIVQDRGTDALRIEVHRRQDVRHLDRVEDIRLAAAPVLALMGLGAKQVGAVDVGDLGRAEIALEQRTQVTDVKTGVVRGRRGFRRRWGLPRRGR